MNSVLTRSFSLPEACNVKVDIYIGGEKPRDKIFGLIGR